MTLNSQCQGFITAWLMCNSLFIPGFWVEEGRETVIKCELNFIILHTTFILPLSSSSLNLLQGMSG